MKEITGEEDFKTPILLFFFYSMLLIPEVSEVMKNIEVQSSVIFSEPILFTGDLFKTLSRIGWFLIPAGILYTGIKETNFFLKFTYLLGAVPLVLTTPIINKIGFRILYLTKVLILFVVVICLMKHLIDTTDLYKKALKEKNEPDNLAAPGDDEKACRS